MKFEQVTVSAAFLAAMATSPPLTADSTDARCDIYPRGEDHASASLACTFSQHQGHVYIDRSDGVGYAFTPTGDQPGNFVDESGAAVYRQSGLGEAGLIFRTSDESVFVYWNASSVNAASGDDSPTAPYTTTEYDATTLLSCSIGEPSQRGDGGSGSASIRVMAPDSKERVLNFGGGDITTPGEGDLTWGKQDDNWYIGIDNREFYVVPEAAVYGG